MAAKMWYTDHMDTESRVRHAGIDQQAPAAGPKLPEPIRQGVLALIRGTSDKEQDL